MATTVSKNGNDCYKWQRPFTKGKIAAAAAAAAAGLDSLVTRNLLDPPNVKMY